MILNLILKPPQPAKVPNISAGRNDFEFDSKAAAAGQAAKHHRVAK